MGLLVRLLAVHRLLIGGLGRCLLVRLLVSLLLILLLVRILLLLVRLLLIGLLSFLIWLLLLVRLLAVCRLLILLLLLLLDRGRRSTVIIGIGVVCSDALHLVVNGGVVSHLRFYRCRR